MVIRRRVVPWHIAVLAVWFGISGCNCGGGGSGEAGAPEVPGADSEVSSPQTMGEPLCDVLPTEAKPIPSSIRGRVLDSLSNDGLPAVVKDACGSASVTAGDDGFFVLPLTYSGRAYLSISGKDHTRAWRLVSTSSGASTTWARSSWRRKTRRSR